MNIVLINPQIPQNTGNIARTCFALNARLHLIEPLGFDISEKAIRRASVNHWNKVSIIPYKSWEDFLEKEIKDINQLYLLTEHGKTSIFDAKFCPNCYMILGPESQNFPRDLISKYYNQTYYLPMLNQDARCLNLSNVASVSLYLALQQLTG